MDLRRTHLTRRAFLRRGVGTGAGIAAIGGMSGILAACGGDSGGGGGGGGGTTTLSVLSPSVPDPAPPGVAQFSLDAFEAWKADNGVEVVYEDVPWPELHDKMASDFTAGTGTWDIEYNCGWVPEFANNLVPFVDQMDPAIVADMPASSFGTVTWDGQRLGAVFSLSLLTLFYNTDLLAAKGITAPPTTWEELKGYTAELTGDGKYGWVLNYGAPEGIGGTASYWMAFLQQAGGTMYDASGNPAFNTPEGVDAMQFLLDLWDAGTDPGSISYVGINDATNVFTSGNAAMMMNWPFMWKPANDPASSQIVGAVGAAILPAGPAGSASIDGTDAWTITNTTEDPELARKLVEFYLDAEVQKRQVLDTGWLPIRLSVLNDPEVQAAASNAAVTLEQAQYPYDSFVTPDYNQVTQAIGSEIQKALQGEQTAAETIQAASDAVAAIVAAR
ncbi:MAG: ABC transporter substrate-binding protein [Actinomycetota bacterium]